MICFDCSELQRITGDSRELCGKCWVKAHPGETLIVGSPYEEPPPKVLCWDCWQVLSMYDEDRGRCNSCYERFLKH